MADLLDEDGQQRLESYFNDLGDILGDVRRKPSPRQPHALVAPRAVQHGN